MFDSVSLAGFPSGVIHAFVVADACVLIYTQIHDNMLIMAVISLL
jgi:hypothetical protein